MNMNMDMNRIDDDDDYNKYRVASLFGWISIGAWVLFSFDQIWTCYNLKSGEGLSIAFIIIWLLGDAANFIGALWQGLLLTMIILAFYYILCDFILISQVYFYRHIRFKYPNRFNNLHAIHTNNHQSQSHQQSHQSHQSHQSTSSTITTEHSPLLLSSSSNSNSNSNPNSKSNSKLSKLLSSHPLFLEFLKFFLAIFFVFFVGFGGWIVTGGLKKFPTNDEGESGEEEWDTKAQVFGWISAFLYLSSRLPQIFKNTQTKCEGLSLLMFCFSMIGNLTYVASILVVGNSNLDWKRHLVINFSWIVGSGGTIILDIIIIVQFVWYREERKKLGMLALNLGSSNSNSNSNCYSGEEEEELNGNGHGGGGGGGNGNGNGNGGGGINDLV